MSGPAGGAHHARERELFIDNLLVRIHLIIEMIWWTGLAPWEFEFPFPGSLLSTYLGSLTLRTRLQKDMLRDSRGDGRRERVIY